jgi:hypothetical protein
MLAMSIIQEAQRVHDTLFPNHQSTLKVTDPEFIELFDNWRLARYPPTEASTSRLA